MAFKGKPVSAAVALAACLALTGCGGGGTGSVQGAADSTLDIAWAASPSSIVPSENATLATRDIGLNVYEGLVAFDENYKVQPMLASSWIVADDGKSVAFTLRNEVSFHDGSKMTPEDVRASIEHWRARNVSAAQFLGTLNIQIAGNVITLSTAEPTPILDLVAGTVQPLVVMPAAVLEGVGAGQGVSKFIGTGPYKFVNWAKDQAVELTRFDDYVGVDAPPSGYSGSKAASIENLKFSIVTDPSARVSGLQSGTYDVSDQVQSDEVSKLKTAGFDVSITQGTFSLLFFNHQTGPMVDKALRQAVYSAVDIEAVEQSTFASPDYYTLDGALAPEGSAYYTTEGLGDWNAKDITKATALVEESSYKGETIRILATKDYPQIYNYAVVVQQTLKTLGIPSEITTQPWTTYLKTRSDPATWDVAFTTLWPLATLPSTYAWLTPTYPGWINSEEIAAAVSEINLAKTDQEKAAATGRLQAANAEYVAFLKSGNEATIMASSSSVDDIKYLTGPIYWNSKFAK